MDNKLKFGLNTVKHNKPTIKLKGCDSIKSAIAADRIKKEELSILNKILPVKHSINLPTINKIFCEECSDISIYKDVVGGFETLIITNHTIDILFKLESFSRKIIFHVMKTIGFNTNRVEIDTNHFCETYHIDRRNFYRGLAELDNKQILYRTNKQGIYSVNPSLIFRGSRVKFVKYYELKYRNEPAQLDSKGRIIIDD